MAIFYMMTAFLGALVSCTLLWPYGAAIALLSMPLGGSLLTLLASIVIYVRAPKEAASGEAPADDGEQFRKLQIAERHR